MWKEYSVFWSYVTPKLFRTAAKYPTEQVSSFPWNTNPSHLILSVLNLVHLIHHNSIFLFYLYNSQSRTARTWQCWKTGLALSYMTSDLLKVKQIDKSNKVEILPYYQAGLIINGEHQATDVCVKQWLCSPVFTLYHFVPIIPNLTSHH